MSKRIKQKKRKQQQTRCLKSLFIIKMEIYYCAGLNVIIWMSCPKVFCTKHWYCRKLSLVRYLMNSIALLMLFSARILDGMWFCVAYKNNNNNNNSKRYLLAIIWSYYGKCPFLFLSTKILLMKTTKGFKIYQDVYKQQFITSFINKFVISNFLVICNEYVFHKYITSKNYFYQNKHPRDYYNVSVSNTLFYKFCKQDVFS